MVCSPYDLTSVVSINDILERYYRNEDIGKEELVALVNYERYQLRSLHKEKDEEEFHNRFLQLQVLANVVPYQEFLKEEYSGS